MRVRGSGIKKSTQSTFKVAVKGFVRQSVSGLALDGYYGVKQRFTNVMRHALVD